MGQDRTLPALIDFMYAVELTLWKDPDLTDKICNAPDCKSAP